MPSEPWPLYQGKWGKRRRRKKKLMYSSTTAFNAQSTMTITSRQMGKKEEEEEEDEEADVLNSGYHKNLRFYSHAIRPLDCDGLHSGCLMTCYQFATDYFLPPPPPSPQQHMYGLIGYVSILAVFALKDVTDKSVPWWKILISACHSDWKKNITKM